MRSSRLLGFVPTVVSTWGNTFAIFANSMMMILRSSSFIVMNVEFVELVAERNSFIAKSVDPAIQWICVIITYV